MLLKLKNIYKEMSIVRKATLWFLICSILQKGIVFLTTPIFTRLMSTEQYGQYNIYITWFQILTIITSFRLDYAVFNKGMSKYEDKKDSYTSTMQIVTIFITLFFFLMYLLFRNVLNKFTELSTGILILMFINVIFMNSISFWTIRKRYDYKYKSVVFITLLLTIATTLISIFVVVKAEDKGVARIISLAITQIIIGFIIFIYILKKGKPKFNKEYAKFALKFNLPLIPHYLSIYILEQSDKIMIQKMSGAAKVGIYSVAYSIGNAINIVSSSINQAIIPWLYKKLKDKNFQEIQKKIMRIFLMVLVMISVFILIVPELLNIIATKDYNEAIYVIAPVSASAFFAFIYNLFATIEFYFDKNKYSMILSGIAAITNIILNLIFIKVFDYRAAGYTTMICYGILAIGHLIYTNKIVKIEENIYIIKSTTMILIILLMISIVIIAQILYNFTTIKYLILLIILAILVIKRKKIIHYIQYFK